MLDCLDTKGNSPGGISYLLKVNGRWVAFTGDVMLDGAKMHTWFDTEWDYGFAQGLYELTSSVNLLQSYEPAYLLPSHDHPTPPTVTSDQRPFSRGIRANGRGFP